MTARTYELTLPYDKPPLMKNDRMHWAKKARITREIRTHAFYAARAAKAPRLILARVELHWVPDVRRPRDVDGPMPTCSAAQDGCTDAGVWPDDDSRHVVSAGCVIHPVDPGAARRVWLRIEEVAA